MPDLEPEPLPPTFGSKMTKSDGIQIHLFLSHSGSREVGYLQEKHHHTGTPGKLLHQKADRRHHQTSIPSLVTRINCLLGGE